MLMANIKIEELGYIIDETLNDYSLEVAEAVKRETENSMNKLVSLSKATAPTGRRAKHYKDQISSLTVHETARQLVKVWYVKGTNYRLTHLLNNGHQLRDGGRYEGTQFLTKACDQVIPEYEQAIEEVIKNDR